MRDALLDAFEQGAENRGSGSGWVEFGMARKRGGRANVRAVGSGFRKIGVTASRIARTGCGPGVWRKDVAAGAWSLILGRRGDLGVRSRRCLVCIRFRMGLRSWGCIGLSVGRGTSICVAIFIGRVFGFGGWS